MRNSKGFTLIELLAVIIILAIVALVTTPTITTTINNSRLEGAKDKAWGTIDGIKLAYTQVTTNSKTMDITVELPATIKFINTNGENSTSKGTGKILSVNGDTTCTTASTTGACYAINENFSVNGEIPQGGTIQFKSNGKIIANELKYTGNGEYYCSTANDGTVMVCAPTIAKIADNANGATIDTVEGTTN